MSVYKRKTSRGESAEYHYDFVQSGHRQCGVCEGCTTKKQALEYEQKLKQTAKMATEQQNAKAFIENFRDQLTGGHRIPLKDGYELSLAKPRSRQPSEKLIRSKRTTWDDFVCFMEQKYPEIKLLNDVLPRHAEEYIQQLRTDGRFNKVISFISGKSQKTSQYQNQGRALSSKTINTHQQILAEVFELLKRDTGMLDNPFSAIPKLRKSAETREAFTEEELKMIGQKADPFIFPLFMIAIATALREGDICLLRWDEIDLQKEIIVKKMNKTGNYVEIPIMPPLKAYLLQLRNSTSATFSEYVLPQHAAMYQNNSSGVSYRVKQFLEDKCGIKTTKNVSGRYRAVSVKDLHSCRHTFCYFAGLYGIPLNIVQSIVGHMSPEMTKHYSAHASMEAKREKMQQLPDFLMLNAENMPVIPQETDDRELLCKKIRTLPIEKVRQLLQELETI